MTQKSTPETCNTYIMCLIYKYIHSLNRERVHFWFICGFYVEQSTLSGLENCDRYFLDEMLVLLFGCVNESSFMPHYF